MERGALKGCEKICAPKIFNKSVDVLLFNFHMAQNFPLFKTGVVEEGTMTTLRQIELSCPICGNSFQSQAVVTTNAFGGKRTDFHERAAGTQPLAYLIHMCGRCGYSGGERDFGREADVSP